MLLRLFLVFTLVPLLEVMILIDLGQAIGFAPTVGIVILTGALGAWAARSQGFYVLGEIQREMGQGRLPGVQLVDGAMVLAGGLLLLTPGLLTDAFGFSLMVPAIRRHIRGWVMRKIEQMQREGKIHVIRR
ncbi:MAG: FxsA family protein [bacterium]|nr:FxsA family protein [bacterium]